MSEETVLSLLRKLAYKKNWGYVDPCGRESRYVDDGMECFNRTWTARNEEHPTTIARKIIDILGGGK